MNVTKPYEYCGEYLGKRILKLVFDGKRKHENVPINESIHPTLFSTLMLFFQKKHLSIAHGTLNKTGNKNKLINSAVN